MSNIGVQHFYSLAEIVEYIDNIYKYRNSFVFRGQADKEWLIESTLTRALKKSYPDQINDHNLIEKYLNNFKSNIRGRTEIDLVNSADDDIWSLGQHFGLYTPLIDWTYSPYIGLFFALQGESKSGIRVVHSISLEEVQEINKQCPMDKNLKIIEPLHHSNERLVNQRGLFLKTPTDFDIVKWILKYGKGINSEYVGMISFTFSDELTQELKFSLEQMNINESTLFPDLMGGAKYSNYLFDTKPMKNKMVERQHNSVTKNKKIKK